MNKKVIIIGIAVVLVAAVTFVFVRSYAQRSTSNTRNSKTGTSTDFDLTDKTQLASTVLTGADELKKFTSESVAADNQIPDVDWSKESLAVAVYRAPTSGYSINSHTYDIKDSRVLFSLKVTKPGEGCNALQGFQSRAVYQVVPSSVRTAVIDDAQLASLPCKQ